MQFVSKKLFVFYLLFIYIGNLLACDPITSNATDLLRLVNYVCVDTNITDIHADVQTKMFYSVDENSKLRAYSMSKRNYPVANSIALKFEDEIDIDLDTNATSVITNDDKIFVGSLSGSKVFNYNSHTLFLSDTNETQFKGRAATLFHDRYILVANNGNVDVIDTTLLHCQIT